MFSDRRKKLAVAIHESGHAVGAWAMGLELQRVAIGPGCRIDGNAGECAHTKSDDDFAEIVSALSGFAAERGFNREANSSNAAGDSKDILRVLSARYGREIDSLHNPLVRAAQTKAEEIVDRSWATIESLANELMMKIEISGDDALAIIRRAESDRVTKEIERLEKTL